MNIFKKYINLCEIIFVLINIIFYVSAVFIGLLFSDYYLICLLLHFALTGVISYFSKNSIIHVIISLVIGNISLLLLMSLGYFKYAFDYIYPDYGNLNSGIGLALLFFVFCSFFSNVIIAIVLFVVKKHKNHKNS